MEIPYDTARPRLVPRSSVTLAFSTLSHIPLNFCCGKGGSRIVVVTVVVYVESIPPAPLLFSADLAVLFRRPD